MKFLNYGAMKKILIYGLYLLAAAVLTAGCIKDEAVVPALRGGDRLTLQLPEAAAGGRHTCRHGSRMPDRQSLCVLVCRGGALAHKQAFAAAAVSGNGTAQPFVDLDYSLRANDKVCVAANYPASVGTSLQGLADRSAESGLASLLVYDNPACGRVVPASEAQPMYGSVVWSAGSEHLLAGAFKLAKFPSRRRTPPFLPGRPSRISWRALRKRRAWRFATIRLPTNTKVPDAAGIGGAWSTAIDAGGMISLSEATYSAAYPLSGVAGGAAADLSHVRQETHGADLMRYRCGRCERVLPAGFLPAALFDLDHGRCFERIPRHRTQYALYLPDHEREERRLPLCRRGVEKSRKQYRIHGHGVGL